MHRLAFALPFAFVAACCAPDSVPLPPRPGPEHRACGVQVWNGTAARLTCRVTAIADDGRTVVLAERLVVPAGSRHIDASLGDDPDRARSMEGWLPAGRWRVVVAAGERAAECAIAWPDAAWAIADVTRDRCSLQAASHRRMLE